jgi:choline dehydrogenase
MHQLRPESKGSVHISTPDPCKHPSIRFNFLAERADRDCLLASMRIVRRLVSAPALAWLEAEEFAPGPRVNPDGSGTPFAPSCRADQLRVHGIAGLRVADASIMPNAAPMSAAGGS